MTTPGFIVKTITALLLLTATAVGLFAQDPAAAEKEAARAALEKAAADATKPPATGRAAPVRLNAPTNATAKPTSAPPVAVKGTAPAPASTLAPAVAGTGAATVPPRTNRPARVNPAFPAPPVAAPNANAVPVIPAAPNANAPGAPNVAGQVPPVNANAANAAAPGAAADPSKAGEDEIFPPGLIKFSDADLSQVLELYQEWTGRTVLKPANLPAAKISIRSQTSLTRAEVIHALDSILSMNQITMIPQGEKFVKAVAQGEANKEANRTTDLPWELLPESGTLVTYVVQLTNAAPQEVATVLAQFSKMPANSILAIPSTGMLVLRDYAENVKRMLEMIQKIDVVPVQEFVDVVIPIKYALAGDIQQVLSTLTASGGGSGTTVGRQQTRTGLSGGGGFGNSGGNSGFGAGGQGYNPANPFGNQQNNAGGLGAGGLSGASAGRSSFANRLNQIVNRASGAGGAGGDIFVLGETKIIADERTNSLLIFASKSDLTTISNIIDKLDVVLAQVLLEAIIMEVKVGDDLSYGFSYIQKNPTDFANGSGLGAILNGTLLGQGNFGGGTNGASSLPGGLTYVASFMNFDATFNAISSDSRVNIVSRPRVQTSHAVEANIFVGQTRPYVTGTYQTFGGGPQTQFQQQQIGLTLSVLPLINNEGLVVMDIKVKVQNVGEEIPIDANFSVPETIDREAAAKVAVRDRETVMLGGFISKNKNSSSSGVPLLKDIPLLGALFRSTKDANQRIELIMLIRPTVLPSPKDASMFAAEERRNLPAVRAAERDYLQDEQKRQKQEDRLQEKENKKLYKKEGFKN